MEWTKDEELNEVGIWLGEFKSEKELQRYALGKFRRELGLPLEKAFEIYHFQTHFSDKPGDILRLVGPMFCSSSYFDEVKKRLKRFRISSYNGGIVVIDHTTHAPLKDAASKVEFIGFFPFDMYADELISLIRPEYLSADKISVWCGVFPSKDEFYSHFNLPDHVVHADDFEYLNDFAEDFKIEFYDQEDASYFVTRAMRSKPFEDVISEFWFSKKLKNTIADAAQKAKVGNCNAIYIALGLDYDKRKAALKKKPRSRCGLRYVGTFDAPKPRKRKK